MKLFAATFLSLACLSTAFQVQPQSRAPLSTLTRSPSTNLHGFLGDQERETLTRDSEPEDFFATNTDKMSDEEKLPIAIAGVAFISLPFIAGLIALYSAQ